MELLYVSIGKVSIGNQKKEKEKETWEVELFNLIVCWKHNATHGA